MLVSDNTMFPPAESGYATTRVYHPARRRGGVAAGGAGAAARRIHFRRMPSVNDGPPDSGFAATSLLAGSPTSRINCSAASRFVPPPRSRPRPSPQLRVLPVRKPPSSRSWQLLALPPWPLRARPCGRLHAPPSPPPRVVRVRQPRSSLSQRLRALPASPPRARLFAQRPAPPSRQL